LDEISKAVVVALLRAGVVGMETIIGRFLTPLNSLRTMRARPSRRDGNSRGKVQNVRGNSSAACHDGIRRDQSGAARQRRGQRQLLVDGGDPWTIHAITSSRHTGGHDAELAVRVPDLIAQHPA
jgi:hypothetical protein